MALAAAALCLLPFASSSILLSFTLLSITTAGICSSVPLYWQSILNEETKEDEEDGYCAGIVRRV